MSPVIRRHCVVVDKAILWPKCSGWITIISVQLAKEMSHSGGRERKRFRCEDRNWNYLCSNVTAKKQLTSLDSQTETRWFQWPRVHAEALGPSTKSQWQGEQILLSRKVLIQEKGLFKRKARVAGNKREQTRCPDPIAKDIASAACWS